MKQKKREKIKEMAKMVMKFAQENPFAWKIINEEIRNEKEN